MFFATSSAVCRQQSHKAVSSRIRQSTVTEGSHRMSLQMLTATSDAVCRNLRPVHTLGPRIGYFWKQTINSCGELTFESAALSPDAQRYLQRRLPSAVTEDSQQSHKAVSSHRRQSAVTEGSRQSQKTVSSHRRQSAVKQGSQQSHQEIIIHRRQSSVKQGSQQSHTTVSSHRRQSTVTEESQQLQKADSSHRRQSAVTEGSQQSQRAVSSHIRQSVVT